MDSLFGEGTSLPLRFFIAFVVVFALIGATAWLIRRFGSGSLSAGARGRAPRLAVIEAGAVDGRRKLVLIRRDNVEHLLMIGGPTDIVVEANIIRGQSSRDSNTRAAPAETRTLSLGEESGWPLQPEPAPRPARAATRPAPLEDAGTWSLQPELAPPAAPAAPIAPKRSRASDALAGLAAELNVLPAEPAVPAPPRPAPVAAKPASPAAPAPTAAADNNLADMASRLEAALKRPAPAPAAAPRTAAPAAATPAAPPKAVTPPPAPAKAPPAAPPVAAKAPPAAPPPPAKPATPPPAAKTPEAPAAAAPAAPAPEKPNNAFSSIEEEMANLLGRPGKPS